MLDKWLLWYGRHRYVYNSLVVLLFLFSVYICFFSSEGALQIEPEEIKLLSIDESIDGKKEIESVEFEGHETDETLDATKVFEVLMQKNVSLYSEEEIQFILSFKESQYAVRRKTIGDYCLAQDDSFGRKVLKNSLIYDPGDGVSYCQIAKVASSSWCNHFIKLGNVTDKVYKQHRNALQILAPKLWPPPEEDLLGSWNEESNLSIVIVRHPMSRLASVYYQKFIELSSNKAWANIISHIIAKFRPADGVGPPDQPTPTEFLSYVLHNLKKAGSQNVDQHWKPQYLSCPFCLLNFNVYARMEDLNEDSLYFFLKSGLLSRLNFKQKLNSAHAAESTEKRFWSAIDPDLIGELFQPWSYQTDFVMFDYSIEQYLDNMGLSDHFQDSNNGSQKSLSR